MGPLSEGFEGQFGERNAPTVLNAAYAPQLLWDGRVFSLEEQVLYPVTHPLEMNTTPEEAAARVAAISSYAPQFEEAYGTAEVTFERVAQAIASFERTLLAGNSPFDRYLAGEVAALPDAAIRGWELFRGKAACSECHEFTLTRPFFSDFEYYNTGTAWSDGSWSDLGRFVVTKAREDKGAFRTPTLRNVAVTPPYMHDGRFETLEEVVEFYRQGGNENPNLDAKMRSLELTDAEVTDLLAFPRLADRRGHFRIRGEQHRPGVAVSRRGGWLAAGLAVTLAVAAWATLPAGAKHPAAEAETDRPPAAQDPWDLVELVAGTNDNGDGGRAYGAELVGVAGLVADRQGNLYLSDSGSGRVRRIDGRSGIIDTFAGSGLIVEHSASSLARDQPLRAPGPLALDPAERSLYLAETVGRRVLRVDLASGELADLGAPEDGFGKPTGIVSTDTTLWVADGARAQLFSRGPDGAWKPRLPADHPLASGLRSLARDSAGRLYASQYAAHRVVRFDPRSGRLEIVAGTGEAGRGDDGQAGQNAPLHHPNGLVLAADGGLLIADQGNRRICRLDLESGELSTVWESGPAGSLERWTPGSLARGGAGQLWVSDLHLDRVLRFGTGLRRPTVITGVGDVRDDGPASQARLAHPGAVASDLAGNVYISDTMNHRVRRVDAATGTISTVAGTGFPGYNGDGFAATRAWLSYPAQIQVAGDGSLYIGDYLNHRVRVVDPNTGRIETVAGTGEPGNAGDGGPARFAELDHPHVLHLEGSRWLLVGSGKSSTLRRIDLGTRTIRRLDPDGLPRNRVIFSLARWREGLLLALPRPEPGTVEWFKGGSREVVVDDPEVRLPFSLAVSPAGELYICDTGRGRILRHTRDGLEVVLENLGRPRAISFDPQGNLLIADTFYNRVLRMRLAPPEGSQLAAVR